MSKSNLQSNLHIIWYICVSTHWPHSVSIWPSLVEDVHLEISLNIYAKCMKIFKVFFLTFVGCCFCCFLKFFSLTVFEIYWNLFKFFFREWARLCWNRALIWRCFCRNFNKKFEKSRKRENLKNLILIKRSKFLYIIKWNFVCSFNFQFLLIL